MVAPTCRHGGEWECRHCREDDPPQDPFSAYGRYASTKRSTPNKNRERSVVFVLLIFICSGLMRAVTWVPTIQKLFAENKRLRNENQKLLRLVGQESEYR